MKLARIGPSFGGVETLVEQPAVMSYYEMTTEERTAIGIADGLVRLSVGIEETADLVDDVRSRRSHTRRDYRCGPPSRARIASTFAAASRVVVGESSLTLVLLEELGGDVEQEAARRARHGLAAQRRAPSRARGRGARARA